MSKLTKIIILIFLIVLGSFAVKVLFQPTEQEPHTHAELPVGSENIPRADGSVIPTTVGYRYEDVRPFDTLLQKTPSPVFRSVLDTIYLDDYALFPCSVADGDTNVVMFTAKPSQSDTDIPYETAQQVILAWEPYLFTDIGQFIFPNRTIPASPGLVNFDEIESVGYKRGVVNFSTGSGFVYAGWRLNYVFYASSLECLESAMDLVYLPH